MGQGGDRIGPFSGQLDSSSPELRGMGTWHDGLLPEVLPPHCRCPSNRGMLIVTRERDAKSSAVQQPPTGSPVRVQLASDRMVARYSSMWVRS